MGTVARIYRETIETPVSNGGRQVITQVQVVEDITNFNLIELLEEGCRNNWHLEGECGFAGEISGSDLLDILLNSSDISTDGIEEDDVFRVDVAY